MLIFVLLLVSHVIHVCSIYQEKLYIAKSNINGLGYRTTAIASNATMAGVMKDVGASMATMNNSVSTKEMMKVAYVWL